MYCRDGLFRNIPPRPIQALCGCFASCPGDLMRIGLLIVLLAGVGCAGVQSTGRTEVVDSTPHEVCRASHQRPDSDRPTGASCRSQSLWWNEVGEALSGAATAARFPRP